MNKEDVLKAVRAMCAAMDEKFGKDIKVLDIGEISPLADYFVIATGANPAQTDAMTDACERACAVSGMPVVRREGAGTGWYLMDCGAAIVHIFGKEQREFYNLERIWSDAKDVELDLKPANVKKPAAKAPKSAKEAEKL